MLSYYGVKHTLVPTTLLLATQSNRVAGHESDNWSETTWRFI